MVPPRELHSIEHTRCIDLVQDRIEKRAAPRLDFQFEDPGWQLQYLLECWHSLSCEFRAEPSTSVQRLKGVEVVLEHGARPVGRSFEQRVVDDDRLAVTRELHIELDPVGAELKRTLERHHRVLWSLSRCASVTDDVNTFHRHPNTLTRGWSRIVRVTCTEPPLGTTNRVQVRHHARWSPAPVASFGMDGFWNRIPQWADWIVATIAAIVILNLNITTAGDPLSGVGLPAGSASPGITEGARATFYGALAVSASVLAATGLIISTSGRQWRTVGGLLTRTFAGVALAGVLGLLLDYRDGPVRTVQLFVYLMLALGIVRLARVAALADEEEPLN